jgi:large subunit ribosomal protein L24
MPTKAEMKVANKPIKLKVRSGDKVMIIAGKDKGEVGEIIKVDPKKGLVMVAKQNPENPEQWIPLNARIKHRKARTQQERSARVALPGPLHVSNVMLIDPKTGQPTRVGRRKEGDKVVRYAKKSGETLHEVKKETK